MATDDSREPTRDPHSELLWQPGRKLDDNSFEDSSFDDETSPEAQTRPWVEPSIEQLKAYRRSELKSPERETVEDALLRSSTVRARLAALSDLEPRSAPSSTRERVLAAFDREFSQWGVGRWETGPFPNDRTSGSGSPLAELSRHDGEITSFSSTIPASRLGRPCRCPPGGVGLDGLTVHRALAPGSLLANPSPRQGRGSQSS